MTVSVAPPPGRNGPQTTVPAPPPAAVPSPPILAAGPAAASGVRLLGLRAGQIVAIQAAIAIMVAAAGRGVTLIAAGVLAIVLVALAVIRVRGRWAFEWLGLALRYLTRRRALPADAAPRALLDLLVPGARIDTAELAGEPTAVISDGYGLTALLAVGDHLELVTDSVAALPAPGSLLPAAGPDVPPVRVQLILAGSPAPTPEAGTGMAGTSYRQLTEGRLLAHQRAVLAVRVLRAEGWSEENLRRALSSQLRRARRRLRPLSTRPLGEAAALRAFAELSHHHDPEPVDESWSAVRVGGLTHAAFRLRRWPDPHGESGRHLVSRLLALPTTATTVALAAGPRSADRSALVPVDLTVRLTAANPRALATAAAALRGTLAADRATVLRLDGQQLDGFAATVPLGGGSIGPRLGTAPAPMLPVTTLDALDLPLGGAGLMVGANRHGAPVVARLFRPEPTRVMLVGGVRAAQLLTLRALALGARVVIQTTRPRSWEPFTRGLNGPGESVKVVPPGPVHALPGTVLRPLLVVVDVGPVAADNQPGAGWQATIVIRDELLPVDVDAATRADLLVLQPLRPEEAALAATALGLGQTATWLTRIRDDMVGVANRRSVRWALLSPTPVEVQLLGAPAR